METLQLVPHPAHPPKRLRAVTARVSSVDANWCVLRWKVAGASDLVVPAFAGQRRQDGLWQTTCFELFLATPPLVCAERVLTYAEFNFSPSERWAAYDFSSYRAGMMDRVVSRPPVITPRRGSDVLFMDVAIPSGVLPTLPWRYGLTAVLEEAGGVKSYWAMAHPLEKPDFHDAACLGAWLAAPTVA